MSNELEVVGSHGMQAFRYPDMFRMISAGILQPEKLLGDLISLDEACRRYVLSVEEFLSWQQAIERHGLQGLRTTRLQSYRDAERNRDRFTGGAEMACAGD